MKTLEIAMYYPWIHLKGGIERSIAALVSRSRHNWTIFTSHYEPSDTFEEFARFKVIQIGDVSVSRDMGSVLKAAARIATLRIPVDKFDVFAVWCDGLGPLTTFRNATIPSICICSTPLRPVYDPVYARDALNRRSGLARLAFRAFRSSFRFVDRLAWKRFDGVIATSLEVKERIVRNGLFADGPAMTLNHPGIAVADAPSDVSYKDYFLVPGRITWTKNIELAIDSFLRADLPPPWRLVIAGFVDQKSTRYLEELKLRAGSSGRVEFVCNPSDEQLNGLYGNAFAVLFPPLNEDWGVAPLEGMLRSKAIVANRSGGPKESVENGVSGWLLEPTVEDWAPLLRSLPDRRELVLRFGRQARVLVEKYDWGHFVRGVETMVEKLAGGKELRSES